MIFRHPHVFGDKKASTAEEVSENWEMMKTKEKGGNKRILSGVPDSMPSVLKAYSMQDKARGVGFDWEEKSQVWDKVKEEEGEFQAELDSMASCKGSADPAVGAPTEDSSPEFKEAYDRAEEELGDFMFATINAARLYGLNPDTALNRACDKFRRRFTYLEEQTIRKGRSLHDMTLAEMDAIWDEGKARGL
jgi:XTP/dITP diphosphohydrolase